MRRLERTGLLATLYFAAGSIGCLILIAIAALINLPIALLVMFLWNVVTPVGWHISWYVAYAGTALLAIVAAFFGRK